MTVFLILYFSVLNLAGLLCMWSDKRKAIRHAWRIPEKTLFLVAISGGSVGVLAGMYLVRHKTKHMSFVIGIPLIILAQIAAACIIWRCVPA